MNFNRNHPLRALYRSSDPDAGGTDTGVEDRGDDFAPPADTSGLSADPVAEAAAADALQAELDAKEKAAAPAAAEDDDKDDKDDKDADPAKPRGKRIPLERHEAILNKSRETADELRRENAALKARKDSAAQAENITATDEAIQAMESEYATLLTDGEIAKATAKMAEIRRAERDLAVTKTQAQITSAVARATESARYSTALERIEAAYPLLNEDHEDFDAEKMNEVILMKNGYEAQGYTPTQAMQKAVLKEMGAATAAQSKSIETTPRVAPDAKAAATAARTLAARQKAAEMVENTPPSTNKVGADSDKLGGGLDARGIMKMSQADFAKLPEEVLARARGDLL